MPELPEIHRFAALINKHSHKRVVAAHAALAAAPVPSAVRAAARGKQLLLTLTPVASTSPVASAAPASYLFGFGLVGHWSESSDSDSSDVRLWLRFDDGSQLALHDAMKMAKWTAAADFDRTRGADPVDEFDAFQSAVRAAVACGRLRGAIGAALLNQAFFNGVGNYLRAELLHRAQIYPLDAIERVAARAPAKFDALLRLCRELPLELLRLGANKYGDEAERRRFADWQQVYDKGVWQLDSTKRKIYMAPDAERRFKLDDQPEQPPPAQLSADNIATLLLLVRGFAAQSLLADDQVRLLKRSLLDATDDDGVGAWRAVLDAYDIARDRAELVDSLQQMCALLERRDFLAPALRIDMIDTTCLTFSSSNHHHHNQQQPSSSSWLSSLLRDTSASWFSALQGEFERPYMRELERALDAEAAAGHTVLPARAQIFGALQLPLDDVRVVILGQDPYPAQTRDGTPHAMGLAFSVHRSVQPLPGSLANIFKELSSDIAGFQAPAHGDLSAWVRKGVLLLNATLTVRAGEPNSHAAFGWQRFTDQIIEHLCARGRPVVAFLLWGKFAASKAPLIARAGAGKERPIVECAHPSPLSAKLFLGSRCFSAVNACLTSRGEPAIDWNLDEP